MHTFNLKDGNYLQKASSHDIWSSFSQNEFCLSCYYYDVYQITFKAKLKLFLILTDFDFNDFHYAKKFEIRHSFIIYKKIIKQCQLAKNVETKVYLF